MPLAKLLHFALLLFALPRLTQAQTARLSENEARQAATVFVNRALEGKRYKSFSGEIRAFPKFEPRWWTKVTFAQGRWRLIFDPPAGVTATVSFDSNGKNPKLEDYAYAMQ